MRELWNKDIVFPNKDELKPIDGIEIINVHTAKDDGYHFLLGAAVTKHKGVLRVSYANSLVTENDDHTVLNEKYSFDDGLTWMENTIATCKNGYGRSHGVYMNHAGKLYVFCPRAQFKDIASYPHLKTEQYVLNEDGSYERTKTVLNDHFWPMCEPIITDNGNIVMAGLKSDDGQSAVAICNGEISKWKMKTIPNPNKLKNWGETTVFNNNGKLIALVRGGGKENLLISQSIDYGENWSSLEKTNFPIAHSKIYALKLSNGANCLIFNFREDGESRSTLALTVGKEYFEKIFVIRQGFNSKPKYWNANEWCYPYAYEDTDNGILYVTYAGDKENCELAKIPIKSLDY